MRGQPIESARAAARVRCSALSRTTSSASRTKGLSRGSKVITGSAARFHRPWRRERARNRWRPTTPGRRPCPLGVAWSTAARRGRAAWSTVLFVPSAAPWSASTASTERRAGQNPGRGTGQPSRSRTRILGRSKIRYWLNVKDPDRHVSHSGNPPPLRPAAFSLDAGMGIVLNNRQQNSTSHFGPELRVVHE
jgi:hypothetical protein